MERHFDNDLNNLNNELLKMATLTEQAINKSMVALKTQDKNLARVLIDEDRIVDELEIQIQEYGIDLLALYDPKAIDLRFITMGMSINAELERIADLTVNIAYKVLDLADQPLLKPLIDIPKLSEMASKMVKGAIDAFIKHDEALAKEVIMSDEESDKLRTAIVQELINDYMVKDGSTAPRAVPLLLIARDLERICDHATSIAEDVIYMVRAKVVKHHPERLENGDK